jgi:2-oxoglutarate/2-oxoacid ferredoxin oxidoreductase subunit alpha
MPEFSWKIGGEAGYGIMTTGFIFGKSFVRSGLFVFDTNEYPSLIRGGHNTYTVRVSEEPVFSHAKDIDILVALTDAAIEKNGKEVKRGGFIIYDEGYVEIKDELKDVQLIPVPLTQIALEKSGEKIMRNNVALGASFALIDANPEVLYEMIKETFGGKKGQEIAEKNASVARAGYEYVKEKFPNIKRIKIRADTKKRMMYITGNEAIAIGAIKAGCKFYSAYPMTPASSIMHFLAAREFDYNIIVKQTEDEIAAIHMAIGASFAGVRAMTATSGGGFALMTEALGLSAMTETPIVIVLAQRPGPSTGMPTHTEQGDLRFAMHASNGEFPRVVIAPGDVSECFYETFNAFNIAEKYQLPVIIITDKFLAESHWTVEKFFLKDLKIDRGMLLTDDELKRIEDYKRYENTITGISPRALPSQENGIFKAATDEHDEYGNINEDASNRIMQVDKRFRKIKVLEAEIEGAKVYGDADADVTLIGWGSTKGPILEAMKILSKKGIKLNYLQILYIMPFPKNKVKFVLEEAKKRILIENNKTAQLGSVIKEEAGVDVDYKILKYDGRPFLPEEIAAKVEEVLTYDKL